ncbi:putative ribosome quality control (RQC) complex YloA/Tae2 family protein [Neobacillus niacini]|uniref:Rqc2 family fibronectin-binding protein n=1 Tax=Neobacillus driksii TaxID=3035913 RepID=UPI00278B3160|nr:NFACT RNA binding domain-containing protein [Neobacillus niacini]MDQ0972752.1 putative ribosome quality control (RQC) complex YloA/Tae2 family protein [Neobacillus niacini]
MSFDGLFTKAMVDELTRTLKGGRINKVHQPYKNEVILTIRANGVNQKLLFSAHPSYARVQLTNEAYENPSEPPMFCMLLRKHIEGYILEDVYQVENDRMIIFEIKGRNEIGDVSYKQLIIEIMGRHSNIVLVDKTRNIILDSVKHVSFAVNSHRAILPGQTYIYPPEQNKQNPFMVGTDEILRKIDFNSGKLDKQIVEHFAGTSPLFAKEVIYQSGIANRATIPTAFLQLIERIKSGELVPSIMSTDNKEVFYLFPLQHIKGEVKTFSTLSEMLDRFYFGKAERDRVKQQGNDIERLIINEKEKNEKKIEKLESTLREAEKADQLQRFGELLTANLYAAKKGMKDIEVIDYYDEMGGTVVIPLDPRKTPSENAQKYFSKYQKAKNSVSIVIEQIDKAREEVLYFENLLQQVQSASPKDIQEIREELVEGGYIRDRQRRNAKKITNAKPILDHYLSSDGTEMIVGKNNKQNDYLTNKLAARDEIWLHTKDIPGSHVVIRSKEPSEATVHEAAKLAAYFSKARNSSSVPVDYTKVRYVKKPSGAKPGFVIYDNQQTVYVTPEEELVLKLKK